MAHPRSIIGPGCSAVALSANQVRVCPAYQSMLIGKPLWRSFVFHQSPKNRGLQRVTDCVYYRSLGSD